MGKGMKAKPNKARKRYILTKKDMANVKTDIVRQVMILAATVYMDEYLVDEEHECYVEDAGEKVLEFWERITRYAGAVDEKLISIQRVTKILSEGTKLDIHW
jgi:hypothetical protein